MLARAMEAKQDVLEQDKGNVTLESHQDKTPGSLGPIHAGCQNPHSQSRNSSVPSAETLENPVKMLRKSHSWPSEMTHYEENNPCGKADETVVISV